MGSKARGVEIVGDRPRGTVVKAMFARYSRMVDFSVAVAL